MTERPLIQRRTQRFDSDEDDIDSKFELVLGAGRRSQHFCSKVYIFRTRDEATRTEDVPEQETTPKKKPRRTKKPRKRIRVEPDSQESVGGREASVGRGGTDIEVVSVLREVTRAVETEKDLAVQGASTDTTRDPSGPPRRSPAKNTLPRGEVTGGREPQVRGRVADVVASSSSDRGGTGTEVVSALREALRVAEGEQNTIGGNDLAVQSATDPSKVPLGSKNTKPGGGATRGSGLHGEAAAR